MTKEQIIDAIKQSPLSDEDIAEVIAACTVTVLSNALIGAGMDLLASKLEHALDVVSESERARSDDDDDTG